MTLSNGDAHVYQVQQLSEQAAEAIRGIQGLIGDAPRLPAEDHIRLNRAVERNTKSIQSALRAVTKENGKALEDRWGAASRGPAVPKEQMSLDSLSAGDEGPRPGGAPTPDLDEDPDDEGPSTVVRGTIFGGSVLEGSIPPAPPQSRDLGPLDEEADAGDVNGNVQDEAPAASGRGRRARSRRGAPA